MWTLKSEGGRTRSFSLRGMARNLGVAALLVLLARLASGFNVDVGSHVMHVANQSGSMFGFAVALFKDRGRSRLLVGAPKYDTDQRDLGVVKAGAVLQCSSDVPDQCHYVPFDRNGNNVHPLGQQLDSKSHQWFGATVRASGEDGIVVACAPRYVWFTENLRRREPVGTCYVARRGLTDFQEFSPCRTRYWGYHRQGSCQAGFDAVISEDGERMFLGAPGAFYWQGQIHSQNLTTRNDYRMTWEGEAREDDQYLGYSVAVGDFSGDGVEDVALGVPKGLNYTGKIALYTYDLRPLQNITGYQLGSYFGYCLAVLDYNGDGLDDIVVGSPMYTDYDDREMRFEVGRVHVMLQNKVHRFRQVVTFTGEVSRGRFGLSLTGLGDIDMDGIADLAVGAPYGGEDGNGAVFIYHGFIMRSGELIPEEMKKPSQVIYASDVSRGPPISTFGWSLSGGMDMDNNLYPDLLVGAYLSNTAILLKSRPIVSLFNQSLNFLTENKTISIGSGSELETTCQTQSGTAILCVDLEFCVSYGGLGIPSDVELDVKYMLDPRVSEPRLFFIGNDKRDMEERLLIEKEISSCKTHQVYILPSIRDKLTPLSVEAKIDLAEPQYRRTPRSLTPILNQRQKLSISDFISIQKNCGDDGVCIPNLVLTFTAPDTFIFRKTEHLEVDVQVTNDGEDAFEARVYIVIPPGLLYNKFVSKDNTSATCSPRTTGSGTTLICDIGNPLPMHTGVHFTVLFQQQSGSLDEPRFEFFVIANSTNGEDSRSEGDNIAVKIVDVDVDTNLTLYGSSTPENIQYNLTLHRLDGFTHEKHLGPEIMHKYGFSNNGPSDILEAEIMILWPTLTPNDNYLLYLLEQPYVTGNVHCSRIPDVNPLNLKLIEQDLNTELLKLQNQEELHKFVVDENHSKESASRGAVDGDVVAGGAVNGSSYYEVSTETTVHSSGGNYSYSSSSSSSTYSSSSSSFSSSSSSSSSGGSYSSSSGENDLLKRETREANESSEWESKISNCGPTKCTRIRCVAGPLMEDDIHYIYIRSRLVLATLRKYPYEDVSISSRMVARVTSLQHGVSPENLSVRIFEVTTPVSPVKSLDEAPQIPWWIIILATLAGILILLIIILILWKCGYFKRHRPEHHARIADDAQPLNPPNSRNSHNGLNGHNYNPYNRPYYPGDEAL